MPAPVHADSTTKICDRPVSGDKSSVPRAAVVVVVVDNNGSAAAAAAAVPRIATAAEAAPSKDDDDDDADVITAAADDGARSGWTRRSVVSATMLKAKVHCGMAGAVVTTFFVSAAVTKVADADPATVKATIDSRLLVVIVAAVVVVANTDAAHPTKQPL